MKKFGAFLLGLYIAIYGIALITDPWTQTQYNRSVRQLGMKDLQQYVQLALSARGLFGVSYIFGGYCLMNSISSMKLIIILILSLDIIVQTGFMEIHQIFQDVALIGAVLYV